MKYSEFLFVATWRSIELKSFELIRASNYTISLAKALFPPILLYRSTGAGTTELLCCMGRSPTVVPYSRPLLVRSVPLRHWETQLLITTASTFSSKFNPRWVLENLLTLPPLPAGVLAMFTEELYILLEIYRKSFLITCIHQLRSYINELSSSSYDKQHFNIWTTLSL